MPFLPPNQQRQSTEDRDTDGCTGNVREIPGAAFSEIYLPVSFHTIVGRATLRLGPLSHFTEKYNSWHCTRLLLRAVLLLAAVDRYLLPARRPSSKPGAAAVD